MPFALVFTGLLLIVTGVNNTYAQMGAQLRKDANGFIPYAVAIGSVGALGYFNSLRRYSHLFLALILISLILSNKGFFQNFTAGIKAAPVAPTATATSAGASPVSAGSVASAVVSAASAPGTNYMTTEIVEPFKNWVGSLFGTSK